MHWNISNVAARSAMTNATLQRASGRRQVSAESGQRQDGCTRAAYIYKTKKLCAV